MSRERTAPKSALRVGERVYIRRLVPSDYEAFAALRAESAEFLRPWQPLPSDTGVSGEQWSREYFDGWLRKMRTGRYVRLVICSRMDASSGAILGAVNLNEIVRGVFQSAFLGYWVGAAHARKGYLTEALPLVIDYAFDELGLHRVEANIMPHNEASLRLARRVGFRLEGRAERYLKIAGAWQDHDRYAITREEWGGL